MKVIKTEQHAGYEVRYEQYAPGELFNGGTDVTVQSAYTPKGDYIGSPEDAEFLVVVKGISPEKVDPEHCVCSIGFSIKYDRWFGWSHRAISEFGIGDVVQEGDCTATSLPVGFKAVTLEDAKKMAIAFANDVA